MKLHFFVWWIEFETIENVELNYTYSIQQYQYKYIIFCRL